MTEIKQLGVSKDLKPNQLSTDQLKSLSYEELNTSLKKVSCKVALIGSKNVGKSSLIRAVCKQPF
jgi:GTP-binding protein EngB required for normal cell division